MSRDNRSNDSGSGCVIMLLFAIAAMPLLGMYLLASGEDEGQKFLGGALLIVGLIVWAKLEMVKG